MNIVKRCIIRCCLATAVTAFALDASVNTETILGQGPCGSCGHCTGPNYIYYACDLAQGPCSSNTCEIEYLPPGYYFSLYSGCDYTCVDAYACALSSYTGPTTGYPGTCGSDCSCTVDMGNGFEDHVSGAPVCTEPNPCS